MRVRQVSRCAAAASLIFTVLAPAASYAPFRVPCPTRGVAGRGFCGCPRRPGGTSFEVCRITILCGFGTDCSDHEGKGENWLRVLGMQAQLRAEVDQEHYKDAARLHTEIQQLLAQETDALVHALSAAAADAKRKMKRLRRRGDAYVKNLQLDLDTAVVEEDFAMAAQLRDEIRAVEFLKTDGTPEQFISQMEVTCLLNDLMV